MIIKNIHIILSFIIFSLFVLSSPIKYRKNNLLDLILGYNDNSDIVSEIRTDIKRSEESELDSPVDSEYEEDTVPELIPVESDDELETEPVAEVENKPVAEVENKPVAEVENKPVVEVENKPVAEVENEPVSEVENEPVSEEESEAMTDIETPTDIETESIFLEDLDGDSNVVIINETFNSTIDDVIPTSDIKNIEEGLDIFEFKGYYGLSDLIARNGTDSEIDFISFIINKFYPNGYDSNNLQKVDLEIACSSLSVKNKEGTGYYFGRNYDWGGSDAIIVITHPDDGYSSISTISRVFLDMLAPGAPEDVAKLLAIYMPLDGMNEKGLTVSVNMVYGNGPAEQNTEKPDLTLSTAIRLLLDRASNVEEAYEMLEEYDLHAAFINVEAHFAITDATGNAIVVEYVDNVISKVYDSVNENFYLTEGRMYGFGTDHSRYNIIKDRIAKTPNMSLEDVRDTLAAVHQNITETGTLTEWSVIYDLNQLEATYFHRLNYTHGYHVKLFQDLDEDEI